MFRKLQLVYVFLLSVGHGSEIQYIKGKTRANITSDNYPRNYPSRTDKEWRLTHDYGRWLISIQDFMLEESKDCSKDFLEIKEENVQTRRFCGMVMEQDIISAGSEVTVHFFSDDSTETRGFKIKVQRYLADDDKEERRKQEAAKAHVINSLEEYTWVFKALVAALGSFVVIFVGLTIYLCLEMKRKKRSNRSNGFLTVPVQMPRKRSNSKSYNRQGSNSSTAPLTHERFAY